MDALNEFILDAGDTLWTWIILPVVILLGLYFTLRTGVVQARMLPEMIRTLFDPTPKDERGEAQSVSAFGAFTISAASRVGVGNIAGVGTAMTLGGPGAIFWMWLMAFVGGASSFVESTLGQLFKRKDESGFYGGPAYYMQHGLRARWMGITFAIILILCFPFSFSSLQANTISATVTNTIDEDADWLHWLIGIVIALFTGLVIFGGVRRIAGVTERLVPAMALLYLLTGLVVVVLNISELPNVVEMIFRDAFGMDGVFGAAIGTVIMQGVKRGMFSNEAGLGSAPNAGASAAVTHPVKQGLVQTLGVYFDTFIVCSVTAFIILSANPELSGAAEGIDLTQNALESTLGGWSDVLLSVIVFLLAFSSILGNYYYGQSNVEFITGSRTVMQGYRSLVVVAILVGSVASSDLIWNTADQIMGLMALVNLIAIALLSGIVFKLLAHYSAQRRAGKDPVFTRDQLPEVTGIACWTDERAVTGEIPVIRD